MKTHARVVVIGGGVVGAGTLYHLARKGWSDVVLVERRELTSGSTWHAAGLLPLFNMSYSVGQIHKSSVELYRTLEAETGQDVGLRSATSGSRCTATGWTSMRLRDISREKIANCQLTGDMLASRHDRIVQASRPQGALQWQDGAAGSAGARAEADGYSRRARSQSRAGRHGSARVPAS